MTFIGIDIGTSAVKAVLVDETERAVAEAEASLATSRPRPAWSEQDPAAWWATTETVLGRLRAAEPRAFAAVEALGLSGQMHGAVLLDAEDRVLRPAILWNDARAVVECRVLEERVPGLGRIAGVPAMPGFTAPKLLWLRTHEPEVATRIARVLLPKDYVRLQLTGEHVTDLSDAAGTLWLDEARRAWSPEILAASGLTLAHVPRLVEGSDPAGTIRPEIADRLGLPRGVLVAGGAGDAAAGGIGIGAVEDGDAFCSIGTSAQYLVAADSYRPYPEAFIHAFCHALPGRWTQTAALLNGASCLAWAARLLGETDIGALLARVTAAYRGPSRLLFLPYLTGERTPHNDADARGVLFGIDPDSSATDVVQAVLEGVAFSFAEAQDCLADAGTVPGQVAAIGGGARSRIWIRILANVLNRPITLYAGSEKGPAFGAARLARLALTGESPQEVCRKPPVAAVIEPEPDLVAAYRPLDARFRRLYRSLKEEFRLAGA
ncbi:xylulokinase [Benzoatithermus flavus]|uniref:Xylulose kinase n=1 Tax=Benzoatithermus flavus TaxID=3108223 RepID=A0ABU8XQL8_9PROT